MHRGLVSSHWDVEIASWSSMDAFPGLSIRRNAPGVTVDTTRFRRRYFRYSIHVVLLIFGVNFFTRSLVGLGKVNILGNSSIANLLKGLLSSLKWLFQGVCCGRAGWCKYGFDMFR